VSRLKWTTKRQPAFAPAFHELGYLLMSFENYDEAIEKSRGLEKIFASSEAPADRGGHRQAAGALFAEVVCV
jgi:hypothetical protein